jgi:hypothetical protein
MQRNGGGGLVGRKVSLTSGRHWAGMMKEIEIVNRFGGIYQFFFFFFFPHCAQSLVVRSATLLHPRRRSHTNNSSIRGGTGRSPNVRATGATQLPIHCSSLRSGYFRELVCECLRDCLCSWRCNSPNQQTTSVTSLAKHEEPQISLANTTNTYMFFIDIMPTHKLNPLHCPQPCFLQGCPRQIPSRLVRRPVVNNGARSLVQIEQTARNAVPRLEQR